MKIKEKKMRKKEERNYKRIGFGYYKRCPYCQYEGGGWKDSGECPVCGETS